MANPAHVEMLKGGFKPWNIWRRDHRVAPDLSDVDLTNTDLQRCDLSRANLRNADLRWANLRDSDLRFSDLRWADLRAADLAGADVYRAYVGRTIFGENDLRHVLHIDRLRHTAPSTVAMDIIVSSHGEISSVFLRGAGVPDALVAFAKSFSASPIEFHSCFISHASADAAFAERLYADLQANGVQCWFAPEDLKIGDKFHDRIEESIHIEDKLLLVISAASIRSSWVEREVKAALEREDREQRQVLFPIRIDHEVLDSQKAWAADVRRQRHIGDFSTWTENDMYKKAFVRLLRDLKAE